MIVKLLTEHHCELLSLNGGYRGSSKSTNVKMPHCWKSHALAHMLLHTYSRYVLMLYFIEIICYYHILLHAIVS